MRHETRIAKLEDVQEQRAAVDISMNELARRLIALAEGDGPFEDVQMARKLLGVGYEPR